MSPQKYPIILLSMAMIAGIFMGEFVHIPLLISVFISFFLFGLLILFFFLSNKKINFLYDRGFLFSYLFLGFIIGLLLQKRTEHTHFQRHYSQYISSKNFLKIEIIKDLKPTEKYWNYKGKILQLNNKSASGIILLKQNKKLKPLSDGQIIELLINRNEFKEIRHPLNPYSFNYQKFMSRKGIYHQIYLSNVAFKILKNPNVKSPYYWSKRIREKIKEIFKKHGIDGAEFQLAISLFIGERQNLDPEITRTFQKAGTIHILAISGLHIGILLLFLNFAFGFVKKKWGIKTFLFITLFILWVYAFITGFSPSVLRAVIMFSFLQIALQLRKNSNIYNALFAAAFVMILFNPAIVYEVGFQLSFLAVLGIISLYPVLSKPIQHWKQPWKWLGDLFFVSLSAQLAILPLSLYYFHQFPVFFWIANLAVIPLLFIILFLGFLLLLLSLLGISIYPAWSLFDKLLELMLYVNSYIAQLDRSLITHIRFGFIQMFILFFILFFFYQLLKSGIKSKFIFGLLFSLLVFQISIIAGFISKNNGDNIYFLHTYPQASLFIDHGNQLKVLTEEPSKINPYLKKSLQNQFAKVSIDKMPFYINIQQTHILHIDSLGIWKIPNIHPEIISLSNSPKINLEKIIFNYHPNLIISYPNNYPSYVNRWEQTCKKYKIEFIDLQQGAYKLEKKEKKPNSPLLQTRTIKN